MSKKFDLNPFTQRLDLIEKVPQLNFDPTNPRSEDAWVLKRPLTEVAPQGSPIGFLLLFSYPVETIVYSYDLSFRTRQGTTLRLRMEEDSPYLDTSEVKRHTESGQERTTESGQERTTE